MYTYVYINLYVCIELNNTEFTRHSQSSLKKAFTSRQRQIVTIGAISLSFYASMPHTSCTHIHPSTKQTHTALACRHRHVIIGAQTNQHVCLNKHARHVYIHRPVYLNMNTQTSICRHAYIHAPPAQNWHWGPKETQQQQPWHAHTPYPHGYLHHLAYTTAYATQSPFPRLRVLCVKVCALFGATHANMQRCSSVSRVATHSPRPSLTRCVSLCLEIYVYLALYVFMYMYLYVIDCMYIYTYIIVHIYG